MGTATRPQLNACEGNRIALTKQRARGRRLPENDGEIVPVPDELGANAALRARERDACEGDRAAHGDR